MMHAVRLHAAAAATEKCVLCWSFRMRNMRSVSICRHCDVFYNRLAVSQSVCSSVCYALVLYVTTLSATQLLFVACFFQLNCFLISDLNILRVSLDLHNFVSVKNNSHRKRDIFATLNSTEVFCRYKNLAAELMPERICMQHCFRCTTTER